MADVSSVTRELAWEGANRRCRPIGDTRIDRLLVNCDQFSPRQSTTPQRVTRFSFVRQVPSTHAANDVATIPQL